MSLVTRERVALQCADEVRATGEPSEREPEAPMLRLKFSVDVQSKSNRKQQNANDLRFCS